MLQSSASLLTLLCSFILCFPFIYSSVIVFFTDSRCVIRHYFPPCFTMCHSLSSCFLLAYVNISLYYRLPSHQLSWPCLLSTHYCLRRCGGFTQRIFITIVSHLVLSYLLPLLWYWRAIAGNKKKRKKTSVLSPQMYSSTQNKNKSVTLRNNIFKWYTN